MARDADVLLRGVSEEAVPRCGASVSSGAAFDAAFDGKLCRADGALAMLGLAPPPLDFLGGTAFGAALGDWLGRLCSSSALASLAR